MTSEVIVRILPVLEAERIDNEEERI